MGNIQGTVVIGEGGFETRPYEKCAKKSPLHVSGLNPFSRKENREGN